MRSDILKQMNAAVEDGHPATLKLLAERYIAKRPKDWVGYVHLAEALASLARFKEAVEATEQALERVPDQLKHLVHVAMGGIYTELGKHAVALEWYALAVDGKETTANLVLYGNSLLSLGHLRQCLVPFRLAIELATDPVAEAHYALGIALRSLGQTSKAGSHLNQALAADPEDELARIALKDLKNARAIGRTP